MQGYIKKLVKSAKNTGRRTSQTTHHPRQPRRKRGTERLNPPPQNGWKVVTIGVALLTFALLSIVGFLSNWEDWTLIPLGFFFGCAYFGIQMWLSWKKDREEDLGDLIKPQVQRGRQRANRKPAIPFEEYTLRQHLREFGGNALKMLFNPRSLATGIGTSIGTAVAQSYSYWVGGLVGIVATVIGLTIADIISALRSMTVDERHELYGQWARNFADAMILAAFAHPGGCHPEVQAYVLDRYKEKDTQEVTHDQTGI